MTIFVCGSITVRDAWMSLVSKVALIKILFKRINQIIKDICDN